MWVRATSDANRRFHIDRRLLRARKRGEPHVADPHVAIGFAADSVGALRNHTTLLEDARCDDRVGSHTDGVPLSQVLEPFESDYLARSDFSRYELECSLSLTPARSVLRSFTDELHGPQRSGPYANYLV